MRLLFKITRWIMITINLAVTVLLLYLAIDMFIFNIKFAYPVFDEVGIYLLLSLYFMLNIVACGGTLNIFKKLKL